jgi:hypothetical protein
MRIVMVAHAFLIGFEPVQTLVDGDVQDVYRHPGLAQRLVYPSGGCQGKPLTYRNVHAANVRYVF